ncbi:MAG: PAS domain-containing protein [Geobacteraceae bacterium]|nr:PAS domain-containing protein [Geobacteraceae bacterium]
MRKKRDMPEAVSELRQRAEALSIARKADIVLPGTEEETLKLLHEFQLRQIELELEIEALRRSREELEASRNKYALLYDFAPVGYCTLDRDGTIQTVNLTGANLLGKERSLLANLRFEHFVAEEDRPAFADFLRTVFASRDKETCRLKLSKGDNQPHFVRIEATATESGDECHAALVDITERRRAEEALRESEYNLAKAQTMSHVGSWRSDPATGELNVSDELLRILHLSRAEATQEAFASVIHPEDLKSVMDHLRSGIEQGKNYEIEHRLLLRDGTSKWVYTIVEPAVNHAGKVVKLYGTTQDITERKQVEVTLRNQKNEFQAIFDAVNDGVMVFDHDGKIQHLNHICPQFFPEEVLSGGGCRDIFHPELATSPHNCPVERAIRGERVETSLVYGLKGHKTRYIDITATPIEDALGEKNRALVFFRDKTLKRLQELQLIQTEKMSTIGVLAAGVAHEINNPLTSVAGYAEALLRRFRDDHALGEDSRLEVFPRYLAVIVREAYHCKGIIDRLLNFSRKSDGSIGEVDINEILQETLELVRHNSRYESIELRTILQPDLPHVQGDPAGLRQVCLNLLMNAHQAIAGEGLVEITTNADASWVYVQIRDTGCGIDLDAIDQIWDPFFTTKESGKGLGLGLAITYNIVKFNGGEISVASHVGEGSQFTVKLPVYRDQGRKEKGLRLSELSGPF